MIRKTTRVLVAVLFALIAVAAVGAFAWTWWKAAQPVPEVLQGQIEATEIDVSSKIPGRIATMLVREGQSLHKGDVVATIESPEIDAKLTQAVAGRTAAVAQRDKADHGAREEEVRQAETIWQRARSASELAEKTFGRVDRLARDGVVPVQRRDEAETQWKTARQAEATSRAVYDLALNGARVEDKQAASALVDRASGAIAEVEAFARETRIHAPADGEVFRRNVEAGEMTAAGMPLVTILDTTDMWATFHVREDKLAGFRVGGRINAAVPALAGTDVVFEIYYLAPAGDYATWRPTSTQGGFDVKTFEVRARPATSTPGLRPGMSVVVRGSR